MRALGLMAAAVAALLVIASPAAARDLKCNGAFKGKTFGDVTVPRGGSCTLTRVKVKGDVRVLRNAYFQATRTRIRGDVEGIRAQTVFVDTGSRVSGSVEAVRTVQFFVYNSTVGEDIEPDRTSEVVQICGNRIRTGNIEVRRSGPPRRVAPAGWPGTDILIGEPLAMGCRGNVVMRGDIKVSRNFADIEFVVRGNRLKKGDLIVSRNTGPTPKLIQSNTRGARLTCTNNSLLTATGNTGWQRKLGQCA